MNVMIELIILIELVYGDINYCARREDNYTYYVEESVDECDNLYELNIEIQHHIK